MSYKWMSIDRLTTLPYLNPTHLYIILCKILPYLLKRDKWLILDLFSRALIAEHIKFLHDLHFLGFLFVADIHNLIDSKGTGTANYIANIVLLPDVVQEQVSSGILLLHFYKTNNHNHNIQHNEISPIAYLIYLFIIIYSVHFLLLSCFFFLLLHFYRFWRMSYFYFIWRL